MLITKTVKIKIGRNVKIKYYESLGYNVNGEYLYIDIKDIPKGSHLLVDVKCDYCEFIKSISYKEYNRNISYNSKFSCCNKCGCIKKKELSIIKYGVDSPSKLNHVKDKNAKTNLEKYGSEFYMNTKEFKIKSKKTNLEKYGSENVMLCDEIKNKIKNTNLEKYGVENVFESRIIKNKIKETNLERYGVEYYASTPEFIDKFKKTCLERYGVEYPIQCDIIINNIINSNFEKYGHKYYMSTDEFKYKSIKSNIDKYGTPYPILSESIRISNNFNCKDVNYIKYIGDNNSLYYCENGHKFTISSSNYHSRFKNNTPLCTICYPIGDQKSIKEKELLTFIKFIYNKEIVENHRDTLEIDIYLPELKLGFEFNGLYYHSEKYKNKNYHLEKTNYFKEKGIRIIHIWEDDWTFKRTILESQIKNWLCLTENKIFARNCELREIKCPKICKDFLNNNHIQGFVSSVKKIGLYYNDVLVSLMTFDKFEGRKSMYDDEWNLSRFCNKLNTNVVGGSSKLLNYFIKTYKPIRIISYADKNWSVGDLYYKLGFKKLYETNPDYKYIIKNKRIGKSKYRKSKLNTNLSESNFMNEFGFSKIYDCGKIKFEILLNT